MFLIWSQQCCACHLRMASTLHRKETSFPKHCLHKLDHFLLSLFCSDGFPGSSSFAELANVIILTHSWLLFPLCFHLKQVFSVHVSLDAISTLTIASLPSPIPSPRPEYLAAYDCLDYFSDPQTHTHWLNRPFLVSISGSSTILFFPCTRARNLESSRGNSDEPSSRICLCS